MGDPAEEPTKLRALKGGRRSLPSIGGTAGTLVALFLVALALIALGCILLGGVWVFEQLWNSVT
jgi:hypothetical protein